MDDKKDWEKVFEVKTKNPFENNPIGVWMGSYCYFCPECGKPVPLCTCGIKKGPEKVKVD